MKLTRVLLRWYKSFHLNYRGNTEKGETKSYRPWNKLPPPGLDHAGDHSDFSFIEIPIEPDITTIVGANESGKSHLLNAITKACLGYGTEPHDLFKRTDLCHYSGIRTHNTDACPHIGLQFTIESPEEAQSILKLASGAEPSPGVDSPPTFTFIIEPPQVEPPKDKPYTTGYLFVEPHAAAHPLTTEKLALLRNLLPSIQFIDSRALLSSEIPLATLLARYADINSAGPELKDRRTVESAATQILALALPTKAQEIEPVAAQIKEIQDSIKKLHFRRENHESLEMRLFKEILGIKTETLKFLNSLPMADRGYIEGQITKWNEAIVDKLNLAHFWRQDEQFSLTVDFKDGILYFEIRDKTESVYTFKERSSGMKYFLSYYIQAKAMEMTHRNRKSIILMDEPDSALSIVGQRNLLAVFESLVSPESSDQSCQLLYTTHSPYLINRNFPRRIRVLKKEEAEEGTQYIEQARSRRYEPVRTALGIDSAPSLFLGSDNILLEGATDQYLLAELIRVFANPVNVGGFLDLNAVVTVSADGVENVQNVLEQSKWADEPIPPTAVLIDSDVGGDAVAAKLTASVGAKPQIIDRAFVSQIGTLIAPFDDNTTIATTEDIVPVQIYRLAILAYVERWLPDTWAQQAANITEAVSQLDGSNGGVVAAAKDVFKKIKPEFQGDFDKMGVFQEVIGIVSGTWREEMLTISDSSGGSSRDLLALRRNVSSICAFIRDALAEGRLATARRSATQSIKRIISDYRRLNRANVSITSLLRMLTRLDREAAQVGTDAEAFRHVLSGYRGELEVMRIAGQERLVGNSWSEWDKRIEQIKRNPLAVQVENSTLPHLAVSASEEVAAKPPVKEVL